MRVEVAPAIDGRGRRLLTTHACAAGALLHREEPWAAVPYDLAATCAYSFRTPSASTSPSPSRLLVCGRCRAARYADRACQAADWASHKPECAALAATTARGDPTPPPTIRLAARSLWRAAATSASPLDALESHWGDLPPARQALYAHLANLTHTFMSAAGGEVDALPSLQATAHLIARLAVNAHTITGAGAGLDRAGLGLYPGPGAMANHGEPAPTAVQAFVGGVLELRALQPLASGEEVTLSYADPARPRPARRAALLEGYCFDIDAATAAAASSPSPPPTVEWTEADGSVTAAGFAARPPCVAGDPAACVAVGGSGDDGAVAWLEAQGDEDEDAAASFELEEEGEGGEGSGGPPSRPPRPPPVCRVVAWGPAAAASTAALARLARALAAAERAADAVEASLGGRSPSAETTAAAVAAAAAGSAALAALAADGGGLSLSPGHFTVGHLASAARRAALAACDWPGALTAIRAATPLTNAALPRASPVRGHLFAERAKLAALVGGEGNGSPALDAEALFAAEEAVAVLTTSSPAAPARAEMEVLAGNLRAEGAARASERAD